MSIKNLLVSLALLFVFPVTIMAGGSTIQVTESESYLQLLNAGDSGQNLMSIDVTLSDNIQDSIVLDELEVMCFPVNGLGSVKLLGNGRSIASSNFSEIYGDGYEIVRFSNIGHQIRNSYTNRFELEVSVDNDAVNQTFMCRIRDIVFYNESIDFEYPHNYVFMDTSTISTVRILNTSKPRQASAFFNNNISSSRILSSAENNIKIDDFKIYKKDGLTLERLFVACDNASSISSAYIEFEDGNKVRAEMYDTNDVINADLMYFFKKTFIFNDLNRDLTEDLEFEFFVDTYSHSFSQPTTCSLLSAVGNIVDASDYAPKPSVFKYNDNGSFSDVNSGTLIGNAANDLFERGIIEGFSDGEFKPNKSVNRAEAAKFLLLGKYKRVDENIRNNRLFSDVSDGKWYVPYVVRAAELRIINGYDNGQFKPADPVNTAEFLKMLTLTFDLSTNLSYEYDDVDSDDWFAKYAGVAQEYSLFPGRGSKLYPSRELSRGEVAIAMHRYFENR